MVAPRRSSRGEESPSSRRQRIPITSGHPLTHRLSAPEGAAAVNGGADALAIRRGPAHPVRGRATETSSPAARRDEVKRGNLYAEQGQTARLSDRLSESPQGVAGG